jgi:hypothetical protein
MPTLSQKARERMGHPPRVVSSGEGLGCGFDLGPCGAFAARLPGRGGPEHRSAAFSGCRRPALGFWRREERSGRTAHECPNGAAG